MKTLENIYENDRNFYDILADAMTRNCLDKFITLNQGSLTEGELIDRYDVIYNNVPVHILITKDNKNLRIKIGDNYYNLSKRFVANSFGRFSDDEEVIYKNFENYIEHHILIENDFYYEPREGD